MMANLFIVYDPTGKLRLPPAERSFDFKHAMITIPEGADNMDVYQLARRLAELLLEQL
jgi:hypothetical protein